ncbi:Geranylgeranyl pyrophosphate synthase [Neorhodopirellula lusitana]|uniref:Geranylgeranyl pyrophosphate synthase n=2 Tax=Neorhodopirellula lusitana TaxID=445327 RepID=A0ABY1PTX8_9BACT|nr:Geranylgeranyl pyrophosphate synthase [Neorhodopirellula lusitana]
MSTGSITTRTKRRKTSHLKDVPETLAMRENLRDRCREVADRLDHDHPLTKDEMEVVARRMLEEADLSEGFLGWTMVNISSAFWRKQLSAVPPERRLFLLPHCLKHAEGCPADYDQFGMNCKECGACSIADFRGVAEEMGYRVLVAEGSPVVMKIIVGGYVDAVVGVACLNVLEKAIDKVLLAGIPCMAVPLLSSDCRNTKVDEAWVEEMIRTPYVPAAAQTRSYVHLMRAASGLFESQTLNRLAPLARSSNEELLNKSQPVDDAITPENLEGADPIAATEAIAYDFLARGGKHSRPFITLAAYDAMTGGEGTSSNGEAVLQDVPDAVRRAALSIETFHKASLVHDDIEDDDSFRYGQPAVHQRFGVATAINAGDYLIGLGYRLLSRSMIGDTVSAATRVDLLDSLAAAHVRLSEGQGAELMWRDAKDRRLKPIDALKIYALKTSPAFEAALFSGIRLAIGSTIEGEQAQTAEIEKLAEPIRRFSRNLGVAFQIINDLNDWIGDSSNKLSAGADVIAGRPTLLWALALERLDEVDQASLLNVAEDDGERTVGQRLKIAEMLYRKSGAFDLAFQLVDKHQAKAEQVADELEAEPLRRLFYFLVDTVLERPEMSSPELVSFVTAAPVA